MFDDYNYKNTNIRVQVKFKQVDDEAMYPWEIAGFLNKLNTVYYKFELLNSICSAINNGISPSDIFIFDHSLPLYQRYTRMNLLEESAAAKVFYPIGLPLPLMPKSGAYHLNLLFKAFHIVNSFLRRKNIQPLRIYQVGMAYEILQSEGIDEAESYIVKSALQKADKSYKNASARGIRKEIVSFDDICSCLKNYQRQKEQLVNDLLVLDDLEDSSRLDIVKEATKDGRRLSKLLSAF